MRDFSSALSVLLTRSAQTAVGNFLSSFGGKRRLSANEHCLLRGPRTEDARYPPAEVSSRGRAGPARDGGGWLGSFTCTNRLVVCCVAA